MAPEEAPLSEVLPEGEEALNGAPLFSDDETAREEPEQEMPRKMRIVAAEDNKVNQMVFAKMVKDLEIDLHFAADGVEAVEAYKELNPDLIFMDISMPRMDGKEATRTIRALEEGGGKRVPIISLTAHAMSGDDEEILKAGMDRYMTKPLRKQAIIQQLVEFCPEDVLPILGEARDQAG